MEESPQNKTGSQHFGLKENPLVHFAGLQSFGLKFTEASDNNIAQLLTAEVKMISVIQRCGILTTVFIPLSALAFTCVINPSACSCRKPEQRSSSLLSGVQAASTNKETPWRICQGWNPFFSQSADLLLFSVWKHPVWKPKPPRVFF